jgi:hypothetical protein
VSKKPRNKLPALITFSSRCILQRHLGRDWYHADPLNRPCRGKSPVIGWLGGLHFPARTRVKAPPDQAQEERSNRPFPQSHPPWSATGAHVGKQRQTSRRFKTRAINCLTALSSIHTSLSPPLSLSHSHSHSPAVALPRPEPVVLATAALSLPSPAPPPATAVGAAASSTTLRRVLHTAACKWRRVLINRSSPTCVLQICSVISSTAVLVDMHSRSIRVRVQSGYCSGDESPFLTSLLL